VYTYPLDATDIVLGILWIVIGLVECFFGYKFIRISMFFAGFLFAGFITFIAMALSEWATPPGPAFAVISVVGLVGGSVCFFFWELALLIHGAYGGFSLGLSLLSVARIHSSTGSIILLVALSLLGMLSVKLWERHAIIVLTAIGGAFAVMWGVDDFWQTGFQNIPIVLSNRGDVYFDATWQTYVLMGCWLLLSLIGMAFEEWKHEYMVLSPLGLLWCVCWRPGKSDPKTPSKKEVKSSSNPTSV